MPFRPTCPRKLSTNPLRCCARGRTQLPATSHTYTNCLYGMAFRILFHVNDPNMSSHIAAATSDFHGVFPRFAFLWVIFAMDHWYPVPKPMVALAHTFSSHWEFSRRMWMSFIQHCGSTEVPEFSRMYGEHHGCSKLRPGLAVLYMIINEENQT